MISHIKGEVLHKDSNRIVIETGGIGYRVSMTSDSLLEVKEGSKISLWTHQVVREDSHTLYGFNQKKDLDFFELLIAISGIGPKSALSILNAATTETLTMAVSTNDTSHLTKVSGIGKKVAEKIVLELKNKVVSLENDNSSSLKEEIDVLEALKALGFSHGQARETLKEIDPKINSTGEKVKAALKILGR
ncbi:MAG: Holliday junction branch migration protein RuvA [Parcubacteria group bacterium CG11_big_fil_rev_8_21_14_0_20_39_22]|nr:MAG: Holliday junction branch migration protein RuvA [Parcubacteria group bacterium CG11_big_fil_rev_8_21_14_0_20_39_22]